jgi:hypothetical protein
VANEEGQPHLDRSNGGLLNLVVSGLHSFRREWIAEGNKQVAPLPSHSRMDERLASRLSSGARRAGHVHVIAGRVGPVGVEQSEIESPATPEHK